MKKLYLLIAAMMVATFACAQTRLPSITLKDVSGNDVRLDTLSNNGKHIVVAFFAPWCKPCNRELKRAMGVQMIPYTLLLDGKGNIVYKHNGYADGAETELFQKVKDCL